MDIKITGTPELKAAMRRVADVGARPESVLETAGLLISRDMGRTVSDRKADPITGRPWKAESSFTRSMASIRGRTSKGLLVDSGRLSTAIRNARRDVTGSRVTVTIDNPEYAAMHHFGGKQTAKYAKNLAMPMTREAFRAGSARRFIGQNAKSFFYRAKSGKRSLFVARVENEKLILDFLLLPSVTIPARPFAAVSKDGIVDILINASNAVATAWENRMKGGTS